jgi:hypothetical protein
MSTKVNGRIMKETAEEFSSGEMAPSTRAIGRTMWPTDMEDLSTLTEMCMSENG